MDNNIDELNLLMTMHMEKPPSEFYSPCSKFAEFNIVDDDNGDNVMPGFVSNVGSNPQLHSPCSFQNLPSASFSTPLPLQEPQPLLPHALASTWRHKTSHDDSSSSSSASSVEAMREMIFRMAAMQPIHIDPEEVKPPKRRNVRISTDPQSVAARLRRERISEKIRILQRLVPGGTKMDTASMLDEAVHYVKFLKDQVRSLERGGAFHCNDGKVLHQNEPGTIGVPVGVSVGAPLGRLHWQPPAQGDASTCGDDA